MTRYVANRLVQIVLVMLVMSFVVYGLIGLMPGDPIDILIGSNPRMTAEDAARLRALYGLDRSIMARYGAWLLNAIQGDFGFSRSFAIPTIDVLVPRLGNTLLLMGLSFALSVALAFPLAIAAARKAGGPRDTAINLLSFAGISVPPFWLALLLIILFAVVWRILPASGSISDDVAPGFWNHLIDRLAHLVLPVLTLTLVSVGHYTRFIRAAMIESLRLDYIRTARAKGLPERRVVWGHALGNAMIPVLTVLALSFGGLFGGALITETMFALPGMGKAIYDAIMGNDYNLALVGLLLATLTTLLGNFAADLGYAWLDPRIKLG
jgi:peptide/nickel transport system permease protein